MLKGIDLRPDLFHLNDYQTSLIPAYLKTLYRDDLFYLRTGTLLTIHNLGYHRASFLPASSAGPACLRTCSIQPGPWNSGGGQTS